MSALDLAAAAADDPAGPGPGPGPGPGGIGRAVLDRALCRSRARQAGLIGLGLAVLALAALAAVMLGTQTIAPVRVLRALAAGVLPVDLPDGMSRSQVQVIWNLRLPRTVMAIVGGAKVSTKIDLLMNLVRKVDALVIGGGMANTFLAARGTDVGKSLCEHDLAGTAKQIMIEAAEAGCALILPSDGVVAREFKAGAASEAVAIADVPADAMILDVGPKTVEAVNQWIDRAATLVWNGPLGAFEIAPFDAATVAAAKHAAARTKEGKLVSVAGGGDTVAALNHAGVADAFTYVSTAGGAFLEWMEGKPLPGVDVLKA